MKQTITALRDTKCCAKLSTGEDIEEMIDFCQTMMFFLQFDEHFRERTTKAWTVFAEQKEELCRMMDEDIENQYGEELIVQSEDILHIALDDISFEMGHNGEKLYLRYGGIGYRSRSE